MEEGDSYLVPVAAVHPLPSELSDSTLEACLEEEGYCL